MRRFCDVLQGIYSKLGNFSQAIKFYREDANGIKARHGIHSEAYADALAFLAVSVFALVVPCPCPTPPPTHAQHWQPCGCSCGVLTFLPRHPSCDPPSPHREMCPQEAYERSGDAATAKAYDDEISAVKAGAAAASAAAAALQR